MGLAPFFAAHLCLLAAVCAAVPAPTPYVPLHVTLPVAGVYAYDKQVRVEWDTFGDLANCGLVDVDL
jgi:hypothetical protein